MALGRLLIVGLLHAAMLAPIVPLSDALATTAAHRSESEGRRRFDYGWLRAAGSAAFIVGTTLSSWAAGKAGLPSIIWISGALLVIGGFAALILPKLPAEMSLIIEVRPPIVPDWALQLRLAVYRRVLIIAALVEGSHALHDAFSVIRWLAAGIDLSIVSLISSKSVLSEVVVFLVVGPRLVRLIGPGDACALAAWRWSDPVDRRGIHHLPGHVGACAALARPDIRAASFGLHATDCAGGADPAGSDRTIDLRHIVRWFGDRATYPGFRPAVRANGRGCISCHGRALSAGVAAVRRAAPPHECRHENRSARGHFSRAHRRRVRNGAEQFPAPQSAATDLLLHDPADDG